MLALVLNGIKQTISASVRAGISARALEKIFSAELALVTEVLSRGIYRGGSP